MGQMRLNDVVGEIVGAVIAGQSVNKREAAVARWDDIDADGQYLAGIDGVVARIDQRARACGSRRRNQPRRRRPSCRFNFLRPWRWTSRAQRWSRPATSRATSSNAPSRSAAADRP